MHHRYVFQPYTDISKITCPACGHRKCFTRYIRIDTREIINDAVGICDRTNNCKYHLTPTQFYNKTGQRKPIIFPAMEIPVIQKPIEFLPHSLSEKSLRDWNENNFAQWLISLFGIVPTELICKKFYVGTAKHWVNSTVFWQVDFHGKFRQCKIILYDKTTGKRVKSGSEVIEWDKYKNQHVKKTSEIDCVKLNGKFLNDETSKLNLSLCFFGERQLYEYPLKKVGIVEAEKTAIILSFFLPEYIWIATGGKYGCKWTETDVCRVLKEREVVLFPDLGGDCYSLWKRKASEISNKIKCKIVVSDFLESVAARAKLQEGDDLADYVLINHQPHIIFTAK